MDNQPKQPAFNYKTGEYEQVNMLELSPDRLREFMPQIVPAQGLFDCYLELEESPIKAYLKTMEDVAASYKKQANSDG